MTCISSIKHGSQSSPFFPLLLLFLLPRFLPWLEEEEEGEEEEEEEVLSSSSSFTHALNLASIALGRHGKSSNDARNPFHQPTSTASRVDGHPRAADS
ncbi:hypothetical protein ACKS0A_03017 [Histoplasma ohiense]